MIMSLVSYWTLFLTLFISEIILGIDSKEFPLLSKFQLLALLMIIFPVSSFMCVGRNWKTKYMMERSVLNGRYRSYLPY